MTPAEINGNATPGITFKDKIKQWSDNAAAEESPDWEIQIKMLSEIGELITPDLSMEEVIATIYSSVNHLMDAYQFSVGLFDDKEMTITFKGIIENGRRIPDLVIDAATPNRLAPRCVLFNEEIFINDMDAEYKKYVTEIPKAYVGTSPKAALYVPVRMHNKVAGLIAVRTIHKHVYHRHHLYMLRTLGNFVIRSIALAEETGKAFVQGSTAEKRWKWNAIDNLKLQSKKHLLTLTEREKDVLFLMVSGLTNKEIAEKLFDLTKHSKNAYLKSISKTGCQQSYICYFESN